MPVSALVVTLDDDPVEQAVTISSLSALPHLTVGAKTGRVHVPVVCESETLTEGEHHVRELMRTPGVVFVDVVMVDFSDLDEVDTDVEHRGPKRSKRAKADVDSNEEWATDLLAESYRSEA
jgi:nitrate reductase NapAB chaperone NapD